MSSRERASVPVAQLIMLLAALVSGLPGRLVVAPHSEPRSPPRPARRPTMLADPRSCAWQVVHLNYSRLRTAEGKPAHGCRAQIELVTQQHGYFANR